MRVNGVQDLWEACGWSVDFGVLSSVRTQVEESRRLPALFR